MVTIDLSGHKVEAYDGIDDLPIGRFHRFQKYTLVDAGIGSDIQAFDRHLEKTRRFVMAGDKDSANKEIENLRQCVWQIQTGQSPKMRSFACLVSKIDGVEYDGGEDAVDKVLSILEKAPVGILEKFFEGVKKKINSELNLYFPGLFNDASVREYYDLLRARTLAVLKKLTGQEAGDIDLLTTRLLVYSKPQVFTGSDGTEVTFDRQYEDMCIAMSEQLHIDAKKCTVLEFYNAYEFLRERNRRADKAHFRAK